MGSNYADSGNVPIQVGSVGGGDDPDFDVEGEFDTDGSNSGSNTNIVSGNARVGIQAHTVRGANVTFRGKR